VGKNIFLVFAMFLFTSCASVKYFDAIRQSDFDKVKYCIEEEKLPVNFSTYDGTTGLIIAAEKCDTKTCTYLISKGADIKLTDNTGFDPFLNAMYFKCTETAMCLIKAGADIKRSLPDGRTALLFAVEAGDMTMTARLVDMGADVNFKTKSLYTPLMAAANLKNSELLNYLIGKGAAIDDQSGEGFTPLMYGVLQRNTDIVQSLIKAGADVNKRCIYGRAIDFATVTFALDLQKILHEAEGKK
jgi:ankyrin repeat protein